MIQVLILPNSNNSYVGSEGYFNDYEGLKLSQIENKYALVQTEWSEIVDITVRILDPFEPFFAQVCLDYRSYIKSVAQNVS